MSAPIEIEKRFKVTKGDIADFLKAKKFISTKTVVDEYLDTPEGMFYQDGIFIRLRNEKSVDIKFNPDHLGRKDSSEHVVCHEYNIPVPFEPSSMNVFETVGKMIPLKCPAPYSYEEFLNINNLQPLVVLDKKRATYEDDIFVIAVDEFADFGTFLELEAKDNSMGLENFMAEVAKATQGIVLEEIHSGYVEMRLREINKPLYLKGKYLLPEEKAAA